MTVTSITALLERLRARGSFLRGNAVFVLFFAWLLAAVLTLRFSSYGLTGIEAYYWDWSRLPDWSYFSKPPLVAYAIWISTHLLGSSEWAIRSSALVFFASGLFILYRLTLELTGDRGAARAGLFMALGMSIPWGMWFSMKTDGPLFFFWILAMYAFQRAIKGSPAWWWMTGFAMAGGVLSKYTALLLLVSLAAYLLLFERQQLRTPFPYAALGVVLVGVSGVMMWNLRHSWSSVQHTYMLNTPDPAKDSLVMALERLGNYLLTFFLMQWGFSIFSLLTIIHLIRRWRSDPRMAFLLLCFLSSFITYAFVSLKRDIFPHWPLHGTWALAIGFGILWSHNVFPRWTRPVLVLSMMLGLLATFFAPSTHGDAAGPVVGKEVSSVNAEEDPGRSPFLFSYNERYCAWMAYYVNGRPRVYSARTGQLFSQYDIWDGWDALIGRDALLLEAGSPEMAERRLKNLTDNGAFRSGRIMKTFRVPSSEDEPDTFNIIRLEDYSGGKM